MSYRSANVVRNNPRACSVAIGMTNSPIEVEIWSDIACPWCYIGKRRFEAAVAQRGAEVNITYRSYELSPDTPADFVGHTKEYFAQQRGLPAEQVDAMLDRVTEVAQGEGLQYDYDAVKHVKTQLAHQLLHFAKAHGKQLELKERLLAAYFTEGEILSDVDTLARLAGEVGLDKDAARQALMEEQFSDDVSADIAQARTYGISGVPFFLIGQRIGVSGAQPTEVFAEALDRAIADDL